MLAHEPTHRVALDNASWVAYRLGDFERSAELYDRWRLARPEDPGPWAGVIAATIRCGRLDDAERKAQEGLRRFPANPDSQRNAAMLRQIREEGGP